MNDLEFFGEQESLNFIQWVLRAIVAFFFLLIVAKIMGQRSISQLRLIDFMMALLIGNIIAHPLSDEQLGLKGSMITISVLVILYTVGVYLSLKWRALRKFLEPTPIPLIKNGQIIYKGLLKARISLDVLLSELRKQKIDDIDKVSLALWEPGGSLSVFLFSQYNTVTPTDMRIAVKPLFFPMPIVKEGQIDVETLNQFGKDEIWLKKKIHSMFAVDLKEILLATIDSNDEVKIFTYK
ncbi:DUF421 domain-containing protein [Oceanobacillus sp. AG]|uniref:DUF421 domain-containing protein n=1 Tax=Oceanobacillus sp. AG TaxID=2681969 RepID=UPI00351AADD2